jgi:hypothetical protein
MPATLSGNVLAQRTVFQEIILMRHALCLILNSDQNFMSSLSFMAILRFL